MSEAADDAGGAGGPERPLHATLGFRVALGGALLAALVAGAAAVDLEPDLSHLDVSVLSGSRAGHYHAVVEAMAREAAKRGGRIENVSTAGSIDNVQRLEAGAAAERVQFALAQAGSAWNEATPLELVARLPTADTVLFLGRDADRFTRFADLAGKRVGIGPAGSGTARVAQQLLALPGLAELGVQASHHALDAQLDLLERGELDLGVFVIQERAELVMDAVRRRRLQLAGFEHVRALADTAPPLRAGRIVAGAYDPVAVLPPTDKPVLRLDTLVLGDGSASRSETVALLQLLTYVYPQLIDHNRGAANDTALRHDPHAQAFFDARGADLLTEYAPWLADVMPLSNLVHLVMAVSILFNLMGGGNKFALWRIDAARVKLEERVDALFGAELTIAELARREPTEAERTPARRGAVEALIRDLLALERRCRRLSVSLLVPMGGELRYRFQEELIAERLAALRAYHGRL